MSSNANKELTSNDLILQMLKAKPKLKKSIEQQDSESLNTMDYYKEDGSNKNSLIDEAKANNILLHNPNKNGKTLKTENDKEKNDISTQLNRTNKNLILNQNSQRKKSAANIQKILNNPKTPKDSHSLCSNCNLNFGLTFRICSKCKKFFCKNCFYNLNNSNNNKDFHENNLEQNKHEKICFFCKNNINSNTNNKNAKFYMNKKLEPLDSLSEDEIVEKKIMNKTKKKNTKNEIKIKPLKDMFNEYEELLNKINDSKIEIDIKKNICMNIIQMIKKAIEIEYNKNLTKLNELCIKINKIKEDINSIINNQNNIYENEVELQINIDTFKSTLNSFYKIFDNFNSKILSRTIFRGFKLYESSNILINQSDTYFMKNKEILTDLPFGNVYLKIDRFMNNYKNYLNFSTLIKQKTKINSDLSFNNSFQNDVLINKSRFVVNMIINNKVIRLNKNMRDNSNINLSYESSEEENKLLFNKDKYSNNNYKVKDFNAKVIISEIIL